MQMNNYVYRTCLNSFLSWNTMPFSGWQVVIIIAPKEFGYYGMIGSVWLYVCLFVCMLSPTFPDVEWPEELVLGAIVRYRLEGQRRSL